MTNHKLDILQLARTDALDFLCSGVLLGEGSFRAVYNYDSTGGIYVAKIAKNAEGIRCNIEEYNTWSELSKSKVAKWFAPCLSISTAGTILIQNYTENLKPGNYNVPAFFDDVKPENFGLWNGKVVCRDYGQSFLRLKGINVQASHKLVVS